MGKKQLGDLFKQIYRRKKSLHSNCFPINFAKYFRMALLCRIPVNNCFFVNQQYGDNVKTKIQAKTVFRAQLNIYDEAFFAKITVNYEELHRGCLTMF